MQRIKRISLIFCALILFCAAVGYLRYSHVVKLLVASNPTQATNVALSEGQGLFKENCVLCHGPRGRGDGELAPDLAEAPPDLSEIPRIFPGWTVTWMTVGGDVMPVFAGVLSKEEMQKISLYVDTLSSDSPSGSRIEAATFEQ